jgi:hypothetical protein
MIKGLPTKRHCSKCGRQGTSAFYYHLPTGTYRCTGTKACESRTKKEAKS